MKMNVSEHDFINISEQYTQHKDNFSYYGKKALYKYLVDLEEDIGKEMEMDWIGICCDYTEWDSRKLLKSWGWWILSPLFARECWLECYII